VGLKVGNNRCPLFTMLMKQNLIKVLHCELVKKKYQLDLLGDPPILEFQRLCLFFKENCLIIMCDLPLFKNSKFDLFLCPTCHFLRKWYYYHKLLAPFKKSKIDLFSQVTCPF
jgi:hypothetical protein